MRHLFFILLCLLPCCFVAAQDIITMGSGGSIDEGKKQIYNRGIEKRTVYLMAIGIKEFDDKTFDKLESVDSMKLLKNFKNISKKYLPKSYINHPKPFLLTNYVKKDAIIKDLRSLCNSVDTSSVVIISALSHGVIENNEYYFICSDTQSDNYISTAISGSILRSYFEEMANKGALVLVFLDTCHSGALFDKQEFTPNSNGSIVFFASSRKDQKAKEIYKQCKFTKTIMDVFLNRNPIFFNEYGLATIGSFMKLTPEALGLPKKTQEVKDTFFSNDKNIGEFPIIKKKAEKNIPSYFYLGAAVGTNIKPTPYVNVHLGFDIDHFKIEGGMSQAFTKSDEVCIYDNNGIMQNEYKYRGWNLYGRVGYNIMNKESPWEFVPLVGISWNKVSGEQVGGFNSNIGESAHSVMGSVSCRIAYDVSKNHKRSVFVHGTLGYEFGGKVKNLNNDYIKKWCSNRLYAEIGFVITSNLLKK